MGPSQFYAIRRNMQLCNMCISEANCNAVYDHLNAWFADNDSNEPVITQEISRVTDDPTNDEPVKNDEDQKAEEDVEKQDGGNAWFSGWGLSSLTGVVNKTSSVVQQTTSAVSFYSFFTYD